MYRDRIKRIINDVLYQKVDEIEEINLFESGLFDSLTTLKLFRAIEKEFSITIDLADIEITDFETVEKINQYLVDRQ